MTLCSWEGNRRSGIALDFSDITKHLDLHKGDKHTCMLQLSMAPFSFFTQKNELTTFGLFAHESSVGIKTDLTTKFWLFLKTRNSFETG